MKRKKKRFGIVAGIAVVLIVIVAFVNMWDVFTERGDVEMEVPEEIQSAGHGFNGSAFDEAMRHIFDYLQEIGLYAG